MEPIIKKAIEGGYNWSDYSRDLPKQHWHKIMITDPLFWQALGKACGWEDGKQTGERWHFKIAMDFYRVNLTEGWDKAVEYLSGIIK